MKGLRMKISKIVLITLGVIVLGLAGYYLFKAKQATNGVKRILERNLILALAEKDALIREYRIAAENKTPINQLIIENLKNNNVRLEEALTPSPLYTKTEKLPRLLELLNAHTDLIINAIDALPSMTEETSQTFREKSKDITKKIVEHLSALNPDWLEKHALYFFGRDLAPVLNENHAVKAINGSFGFMLEDDKKWQEQYTKSSRFRYLILSLQAEVLSAMTIRSRFPFLFWNLFGPIAEQSKLRTADQ